MRGEADSSTLEASLEFPCPGEVCLFEASLTSGLVYQVNGVQFFGRIGSVMIGELAAKF